MRNTLRALSGDSKKAVHLQQHLTTPRNSNSSLLSSTFSESDMNLMLKQLQGEILERTKVHLELSMIRELEVVEKERDERERRR